jgi:hypothetical protein
MSVDDEGNTDKGKTVGLEDVALKTLKVSRQSNIPSVPQLGCTLTLPPVILCLLKLSYVSGFGQSTPRSLLKSQRCGCCYSFGHCSER